MRANRGSVFRLRLLPCRLLLLVVNALVISPVFCQNFPSTPILPVTPQQTTAQQTNDRIMQLAIAGAVRQGDYLIGSGDLLSIEVFDVKELSRDVRVNETGFVS